MPIRPGNHHLGREHAGEMLVEALARLARSDPRAYQEANDLVRSNRVQINGNVCTDPARLVKPGDIIKVLPSAAVKPATTDDVRIVHCDEHLVVIEKPPGVTTMREPGEGGSHRKGDGARSASKARRNRQATLEVMVAQLLGQRGGGNAPKRGPAPAARTKLRGRRQGHAVGEERLPAAPHGPVLPVHRLDRDTSGLMLFARVPDAEHALAAQFKARRIERSYLAVVHGHPRAMTLSSHIVRERGDGLRGSAELWGKDPAAGQRAVTHLEPLETIGAYALVRCKLETGRTHQIRIHLSEAGHMLCGEKEYRRQPDGTRTRDESGAPRQALHAERLGFIHPLTGREMRFASKLPPDLSRWLDKLRASTSRAPA